MQYRHSKLNRFKLFYKYCPSIIFKVIMFVKYCVCRTTFNFIVLISNVVYDYKLSNYQHITSWINIIILPAENVSPNFVGLCKHWILWEVSCSLSTQHWNVPIIVQSSTSVSLYYNFCACSCFPVIAVTNGHTHSTTSHTTREYKQCYYYIVLISIKFLLLPIFVISSLLYICST
jgi:hypothetical protein